MTGEVVSYAISIHHGNSEGDRKDPYKDRGFASRIIVP